MFRHHLAAVAIAVSALAQPALAADHFTDVLQDVYGSYRTALFQTNQPSAEEAVRAVAQARTTWDMRVLPAAMRVGPPYDRDAQLPDSLSRISGLYARAESEARKPDLAAAHETLEAIRDELAAIRQRNQVVVFSDHMNAYHSEMERMIELAANERTAPSLLIEEAGVLVYLARQLQERAPANLRAEAEFQRLLTAVQQSVGLVHQAAMAGDMGRLRHQATQLKGPYSRLFVKYG